MFSHYVKIIGICACVAFTLPAISDAPKGKLLVVGDSLDWGFHGGSDQNKIKRGTQVNWAKQIAKKQNLDLALVSIPGATAKEIVEYQVPYAVELLNAKANDMEWTVTFSGGGREILEYIRSENGGSICKPIRGHLTKTCVEHIKILLKNIETRQDKALHALREAAGEHTTLLVRTYPVQPTIKRCHDVPINGAQPLTTFMLEGSKSSLHNLKLTDKQVVVGLNERMRRLAKKYNARLVDVATVFNDIQKDTIIGNDCVHLTRKGYKKIELIYRKVSR